jgi:hypothetical protein
LSGFVKGGEGAVSHYARTTDPVLLMSLRRVRSRSRQDSSRVMMPFSIAASPDVRLSGPLAFTSAATRKEGRNAMSLARPFLLEYPSFFA